MEVSYIAYILAFFEFYFYQLVLPLSKQMDLFREYDKKLNKEVGNGRATKLLSNSVYILQVENNDLINYFVIPLRKAQYDIPAYTNFMLESASKFLEVLIDKHQQ